MDSKMEPSKYTLKDGLGVLLVLSFWGAVVYGVFLLLYWLFLEIVRLIEEWIIPGLVFLFWVVAAIVVVAIGIAALVAIFIAVVKAVSVWRGSTEDRRRIEEALAKQLTEERCLKEAETEKAEAERLAEEVNLQKAKEERAAKEAEAVSTLRELEKAEAILRSNEAEARRIEGERLLREAEAQAASASAQRASAERVRAEATARAAADALARAATEQATALAEAEAAQENRLAEESAARKAEAVRQAEEAEARIMEAERRTEEARLAAAEIERQNKLNDYPFPLMVDAFLARTGDLTTEWLDNGERESKVMALYHTLKTALQQASRIPLDVREEHWQDTIVALRVSFIIALYNEEIEKVKKNRKLGAEQRDKDIKELEHAKEDHLQRARSTL